MLKEMLEYVVGISAPTFYEGENGIKYSDREFKKVENFPRFPSIRLSTLQSLSDYLHENPDQLTGDFILHVEGPERIVLQGTADKQKNRDSILEVVPSVPKICVDGYVDREQFIINLQSCFLPYTTEEGYCDRDDVIALCSSIKVGTVQEYQDNGCYQKVTIKDGIVSEKEAMVPSIVSLQPFSTFPEVEQPVRKFLFRLKDDKYAESGSKCTLFEADGGAWKNKATQSIAEWLEASLDTAEGLHVTVLY